MMIVVFFYLSISVLKLLLELYNQILKMLSSISNVGKIFFRLLKSFCKDWDLGTPPLQGLATKTVICSLLSIIYSVQAQILEFAIKMSSVCMEEVF